MPLIDQVQQEMVAAMKSGDAARLSALRMLKAALMKQKVDSPKPIDEAAEKTSPGPLYPLNWYQAPRAMYSTLHIARSQHTAPPGSSASSCTVS